MPEDAQFGAGVFLVFLDEVGDMPLELQPKLLRVLQEQEFERLGSNKIIQTDVRLIAATNRDLKKMVADREFRSDLYYRLNVFPIHLPPLRERPEDIPLLAKAFTFKIARRLGRNIDSIPAETLRTLSNMEWPGNVRELENVIERAVLLTRGNVLQLSLPDIVLPEPETPPAATVVALDGEDDQEAGGQQEEATAAAGRRRREHPGADPRPDADPEDERFDRVLVDERPKHARGPTSSSPSPTCGRG